MAKESVFDKKERIRPPRVHISYEVELGGAQVMKELPFVVGVLSDLSGNPKEPLPKLKDRKFVEIDRDNFDDVLKSMKPRLRLQRRQHAHRTTAASSRWSSNFEKLADFEPENVAKQVAAAQRAARGARQAEGPAEPHRGQRPTGGAARTRSSRTTRVRDKLKERPGRRGAGGSRSRRRGRWKDGRRHWRGAVAWQPRRRRSSRGTRRARGRRHPRTRCIDTGHQAARRRRPTERGQDLIKNLVEQLIDPGHGGRQGRHAGPSTRASPPSTQLLSRQLNEILHHPEFQKLEASWRGLNQLVMGTRDRREPEDPRAQHRPRRTLLRDFQAAPEFTESALWKKVYEYEFGLYGGDPYGALVGRLRVRQGPAGHRAARAHLAGGGGGPRAVHLGGGAADVRPGQLHADARSRGTSRRSSTRATPRTPSGCRSATRRIRASSRSSCPTCCGACPTAEDNPVEAFDFEEDVDGDGPRQVPLGQCGLRLRGPADRRPSPSTTGAWRSAVPRAAAWSRACRSTPSRPREGDVGAKCPTEVLIPDTREKELSDLGFIPLLHCKNTDYAAFFGGNSVQRPKKYDRRRRPRRTPSSPARSRT